jgi:putative phosphoribosyl transferase
VDDGVATGATARAACAVVRARAARSVVLAAPVIPAGTAIALEDCSPPRPAVADRVVAVLLPQSFRGVGEFYREFAPTTDEQVLELLRVAAARRPGPPRGVAPM